MSTGKPIVLCVGPERWLRARAVEELRGRCLRPGFEEADFVRFSEPPEDPQPLLEQLRTAPFGSPFRLIVVDGFARLDPDSAPWLQEALERPPDRARLVLCADECAGIPRSERIRVVACAPLKGRVLEEWLQERAREAGLAGGLEPRSAALLVARVGTGLQSLAAAVEELALLAGAAGRVTEEQVRALIPPSLRETCFEILDAAAAGQVGQAQEALREALAQGRIGMDQFLGALGWYYRVGWRSRRWPRARIRAGLEEVLRADVSVKRGHPAPELLADQLLLKLGP
ncbi:MAG: DNA polymerase III subunit delta [Candidatus Omnitrophica bacterium]|nr:DNA polymerase III subunit delta [Candidatus Omnitrophota bacterium]